MMALFQQLGNASVRQLSLAGILQSILGHKSPYSGFDMAFLASMTFSMVPCVSVQRLLLDTRSMLSQCFKPSHSYAGTTVLNVLTTLFFRFLDYLRVRF